jgi:glycosyltransferase involved in cell wall biosynthesis
MRRRLNLIIFLPSLGWGGMGRTVSDVSCNLPENLNQTVVLLEDDVVYPYRGRLRFLGKDSLKPLPLRGLRLFLNVMKFRKILKEVKPDVVLAFHHHARTINCLAKFSLLTVRYKSIIAVLGVASQYQKHFASSRSWLHRVLVFLALRYSDRMIACSEGVKSDLVTNFKVGPKKIDVIYSPVDVQKVAHMAAETVEHPWFLEKVPIVVTSGRFALEKNQGDLVKAFALVRRERPCRLVLLGNGEMKGSLAALVRDLEIAGDVLFLGFHENPFKFIARSTLFAFPSLFEAQGLALVEALAVGCPVVASDCPVGPREILAPGTKRPAHFDDIEEAEYGLLVPVGNVEILAKAIQQLLDDDRLRGRYSHLGKERALHFGVGEMVGRYLKVIAAAGNP